MKDTESINNQKNYTVEDKLILSIVNSITKEEREIAVRKYREFLGQAEMEE